MADHRTKRQKIQALFDGAQTPGEKAAAKAALDRLPPDPPQARPATSRPRPTYTSTGYARYREDVEWGDAEFFRSEMWSAFSRGFNSSPLCPHGAIKGLCQICNPAPNQKPFAKELCKHGIVLEDGEEYALKNKCRPCVMESQAGYRAPKGDEAKPAGRQASEKRRSGPDHVEKDEQVEAVMRDWLKEEIIARAAGGGTISASELREQIRRIKEER